MKRANLYRLLLLGGMGLALTACGGGGHSSSPPLQQARIEDSFGTPFGTDYRASPNSVPVKPAAGDIIPLSLTQQPTPLH